MVGGRAEEGREDTMGRSGRGSRRALEALGLAALLAACGDCPGPQAAAPGDLAALDRAVASHPDDPDVLRRRGRLLAERGEAARAEEDLRAAAELQARKAAAAGAPAPPVGRDLAAEAAALLARAAEAGAPPPARDFLALGKELWDGGERERAAALWQAGIERHPGDATLARNLAYARYAAGDLAAAERLYRRAAELAPDSAAIQTDLAWALLGLGRRDDVRAICLRVLAREPGNEAARALLVRLEPAGSGPSSPTPRARPGR
jgi:tetratricopeptide (TPR) repeat protein